MAQPSQVKATDLASIAYSVIDNSSPQGMSSGGSMYPSTSATYTAGVLSGIDQFGSPLPFGSACGPGSGATDQGVNAFSNGNQPDCVALSTSYTANTTVVPVNPPIIKFRNPA